VPDEDSSNAKANWSLGLSIVSLMAAIVTVFIGGGQLSAARDQIQDARSFFAQSGPVLEYEVAVQFDFDDTTKTDPDPQRDNERPRINKRDIQTYDGVYLQVTVTNVGRAQTAITDGAILVPTPAAGTEGSSAGPTIEPVVPATTAPQPAEPKGESPVTAREPARVPPHTTPIHARFCSNQGGTRVLCDTSTALPYELDPGTKYDLYFSIKENYATFQTAKLDDGFPVRISASGVEGGGIDFRTSTVLEL
jgi:hypothetical protein